MKMFILVAVLVMVCLAILPTAMVMAERTMEPEMTTKVPVCVSYTPGRIEVKGIDFEVMRLYTTNIEVAIDVKGKIVEGNTVFEFVPSDLNCFTFKFKGDKWATISMNTIMQWHEASRGGVGGGSVFKQGDEDEDDEFVGFCLRFKGPNDPQVIIKLRDDVAK